MTSPQLAEPAGGGAPDHPDGSPRLRVARSRRVPAFSQATWGLAVHALASELRRDGLDQDGDWHADGDGAPESARLTVAPVPDGVRVTLVQERVTPGSLVWAIPILFWPFALLLAVMVGRGELPWKFWVLPALFGLAPSAMLAVRWSAHRTWEALATRRARRALDAVAQAVAAGNRLEATPGTLFLPPPLDVFDEPFPEPVLRALSGDDDPDWSAPFVMPADEPSGIERWVSLDEAEAMGAQLRAGTLSLRAQARTAPASGDGHAGDGHASDGHAGDGHALLTSRPAPRPWRERRRSPQTGWVRRTLSNGFGEWLPGADAAS